VAARCYRGRDHLVCSFNALGEGAHETLWGIVAGACEVGERAADAALKRLKTN
jgi:ADP-ribose pyrophosphatase YjhB (NUDIX family)